MNDSDSSEPKRRQCQFSLKTLMLLVTATAASLGLLIAEGILALILVLPMAGSVVGWALCGRSSKRRILGAACGGILGIIIGVGANCRLPLTFGCVSFVGVVLMIPAILAAVAGVVLGFAFYTQEVVTADDLQHSSLPVAEANATGPSRKRRPWVRGLGRPLLALAVTAGLFAATQWWSVASRMHVLR